MSSDFVFTNHMVTVSNQLWAVTSAVGAGLCLVVVLIITVVRAHPVSRRHLDRVSFRLLTYALMSNTVFGVASAIGGSITGPTWGCGLSIFLLQLTLELSSFLIFCIALNLQLVVVHGINGQRMEKYYVLCSVIIGLCLTIPPYVAKQYGWDFSVQDCWYASDNQKERLAWQIGTQLFWTMLVVIGEVCTALTVLIYLYRHQIRNRYTFNSRVTSQNRQVVHASRYKGVIIRIALYPLASCIINLTSVACVIHSTASNGVQNMNDYNILLLSDFVYGGRAVVYALLAATDPALLMALRSLIRHILGKKVSTTDRSDSNGRMTLSTMVSRTWNPMAAHIELATVHHEDHGSFMPMSTDTKTHSSAPDASFDVLPMVKRQGEPAISFGLPMEAPRDEYERSSLDAHSEERIRRASEELRLEALERKQGMDAFKRQI